MVIHLIILYNWVSHSLISVDDLIANVLRTFATCVLVNINLCGQLFPSLRLPIIFVDNLKTNSILLLLEDFNLLSCEFGSSIVKLVKLRSWKNLNYSITYSQYFYSSMWEVQNSFFCFFKNETFSYIICTN